jgi:hypothetical protein
MEDEDLRVEFFTPFGRGIFTKYSSFSMRRGLLDLPGDFGDAEEDIPQS